MEYKSKDHPKILIVILTCHNGITRLPKRTLKIWPSNKVGKPESHLSFTIDPMSKLKLFESLNDLFELRG